MTWNWQLPDWPDFTWDKARLALAEQQFLVGGGVLLGTVKHLGEEERNQLTVEAMSTEAVTTSAIEGEILDRASVQSSIQRQLGLAADDRRVAPKEQGTAEMMVDLYRTFSAPLSEEMLFGWHCMLMSGRRDIKDVGCYRTSDERIQVVSGAIGAPKIHFEAPPSAQVPREMAGFIDWFKRTAPGGTQPLPALTRAGAAHLYFESIHPFEDGKKGSRIKRLASSQIHIANVKKCRVRALNGQMFSWPDRGAYKPGDFQKVGDCFKPYFDFLNIGGEHVAFDATRTSQRLVDDAGRRDFFQQQRRREIASEEIKGALGCVWSAATGKDAAVKTEVINALFGTHSWTAVEKLPPDILEDGAKVCVRMKNLAISQMPQDRAALLSLVKQAQDEIRDERANPFGDLGVTAPEAAAVSETLPF